MAFADLKNDFVFRRIFATHPDILRGLLNDLLDRRDNEVIVSIEYLPSEQLPLVIGAKLSILDVRCRDQAGTTFVVEMQMIHVPGFINRVVYNACKAYVNQLRAGAKYSKLMDVVAISICDFGGGSPERKSRKRLKSPARPEAAYSAYKRERTVSNTIKAHRFSKMISGDCALDDSLV